MEAAGGPFSSTRHTLSVNLQIFPPQRLPITAWDSRADDTESRIGTKLNDHQPAHHLEIAADAPYGETTSFNTTRQNACATRQCIVSPHKTMRPAAGLRSALARQNAAHSAFVLKHRERDDRPRLQAKTRDYKVKAALMLDGRNSLGSLMFQNGVGATPSMQIPEPVRSY